MTEWIEKKLHKGSNNNDMTGGDSPATTLSSSDIEEYDSTSTIHFSTSSPSLLSLPSSSPSPSSSLQNIRVQEAGIWKYSKTRQFTFWVKKSLRDVISPNLNVVYEEHQLESSSPLPYKSSFVLSPKKELIGKESSSSSSSSPNETITIDKNIDKDNFMISDYDNDNETLFNSAKNNEYHSHPQCENIDDAMNALHTILPGEGVGLDGIDYHDNCISFSKHHHYYRRHTSTTSSSAVSTVSTSTTTLHQHDYDWILDGDPIIDNDTNVDNGDDDEDLSYDDEDENDHSEGGESIQTPNSIMRTLSYSDHSYDASTTTTTTSSSNSKKKRKRKKLGIEGLDDALENMELECSPCNTPLRSSRSSRSPSSCTSTELVDDYHNNTENDTNIPMNNDGDINMDKHLVLINNEKLILTPKIHNHTTSATTITATTLPKEVTNNSKEIGDFDYILDHLPNVNETGNHRHFLSMLKHPDPLIDIENDNNNNIINNNNHEKRLMETISSKTQRQSFMDDYHHESILDYLPYEDPSTPEGKFFRNLQLIRHQQSLSQRNKINSGIGALSDIVSDDQSKKEAIEESDALPSEYFSEDFDPVMEVLKSIPWEEQWWEEDGEEDAYNPYNGNEMDENDASDLPIVQIDNFLTEKLSYYDEISQEVTNQLLNSINQNEDNIKEKMHLVQAIDCDVTNALSYAKEANLYLQRARGRDKLHSSTKRSTTDDGMITGGLQIIEESNQRDKLRKLDGILKSCEELFDIEQSIRSMCEKLDTKMLLSRSDYVVTLIDMCTTLKDAVVNDKRFVGLDSLQDLRERVSHLMDSLRTRLENQLVCFISQRCTSIHLSSAVEKLNDEYSRECRVLLKARLCLHNHLDDVVVDKSEAGGLPYFSNSWSESIMKALFFEAERSLARSLLDPTTFEEEVMFETNGDFDENLMEMRTKLNRIQSFDKDAASIRSTIKNLLSIRFQFEKRFDLLPWIYHRLCSFISEILHSHHQLCQWHELAKESCQNSQVYRNILDEMLGMKKSLWMHCKSLLVFLLESFLEFKQASDIDSFLWAQELECNHDILQLSHQIIRLAKIYTNDDDDTESFFPSKDCDLRAVLCSLFERFVRCAHISAMTEVGAMMASDTWELLSIPIEDTSDESMSSEEKIQISIQKYLVSMYNAEISASQTAGKIRPWHTFMASHNGDKFSLSIFAQHGNPFRLMQSSVDSKNDVVGQTPIPAQAQDEQRFKHLLYSKLAHIVGNDSLQLTLGTQTALNGIGRWTIRLLTIRKALPLVNDQVSNAIRNIYDLYFLTIFRLCAGNSTSEDIVIGNIKRSDTGFNDTFPDLLPPSTAQIKAWRSKQTISQSFNRRRQTLNESIAQHNASIQSTVTKYCNADIHSPIPEDEERLSHTRVFIRRAQASLTGKVDLDQIEHWKLGSTASDLESGFERGLYLQKRAAASFSCLFVAGLLDVALHTKELCLHTEHEQKRANASLSKYLNQMLNAVLHLHLICLRLSAARAIGGRQIVMKVLSVGDGWAESKLHEHCNDYVEPLVENCTRLLKHLSLSALKNQPSIVTETWDCIAESGFLALLEGLAKVYDCSTEGRALMSIDLATFSTTIPSAAPKRGMQYVDMYIKVFYFPEEDVLNWIRDNKDKYNINHLMTLVSFGAHNQLPQASKNKIVNLREKIRKME